MKRLAALAVAVAFATLAFRPSAFANPIKTIFAPSSVWDSVYTDSQTVRGDSLYKAMCVKCHGPTLTGTPDGNPLVGADFMASWHGLTLDQIYDKILNEMPSDNPKTVPPALVPDVLAYILKSNGFPAGTKPLPGTMDSLKTIKFEKSRP